MSTSSPTAASKSRRPLILAITAVAVIGLIVGVAVGNIYGQSQTQDRFGLKGTVSVFIDGKLVSTQDLIMGLMYDTVICKVFNDSTACNTPGSYYANFASTSCPQRLSSGALSYASNFYTNNLCAMVGVGLSTDTSTPTNTAANFPCPSPISTNGLAPVKATTSHTPYSNTIVLTATWTASGTQNGIDKACLFPYNPSPTTATGNVVTGGSPGYYGAVQTLFTSTNLATGQSFQVQWTFSF